MIRVIQAGFRSRKEEESYDNHIEE
ncbi:MAG: hypothetical protein JWN34_4240, partial [Bryobacterales bacterium]|nr:hypothetical protein [Bryobacterales bacterium]